MGKEKKQFVVGDLVFAKVKGYPSWPAKITKNNNNKKYNVYFYGTGETANIKIEDLYIYNNESKEKFATPKNVKRPNFREAIEQIEAALRGEDSAPIDLPDINNESTAGVNTTGALDSEASMDASAMETTMDDSKAEAKVVKKSSSTIKMELNESEAVEQDNDDVGADVEMADLTAAKTEEETGNNDTITTETKSSELVSRSGRKIKLKRFSPEAPTPETKKKNAEAEISQVVSTKRSAPSSSTPIAGNNKSKQKQSGEFDNVILAYVHPRVIGVRLDYKKPDKFNSNDERREWEESARKEAESLRVKLQLQQIDLDSVRERIIANPSASEDEGSAFLRYNRERKEELKREGEFVEYSMALRRSLGLKKADADRCLEILEEFKKIEPTELMLLRNADVVEAIRRMRRYIGNISEWDLSKEDEAAFMEKAEKIREECVGIYDSYKRIFNYTNNKPFWIEYEKRVKLFNGLTSKISKDQFYNLCQGDWLSIAAEHLDKLGNDADDDDAVSDNDNGNGNGGAGEDKENSKMSTRPKSTQKDKLNDDADKIESKSNTDEAAAMAVAN